LFEDEEEEELDKTPPARKSPPVKKAPVGKVVAVLKKPLPRTSAVDWAHSNLRGVEDEDDDPILLLSNDDKAEKKVSNSSSGEGIALTMLQEEEIFQPSMKGLCKCLHCVYYLLCKLFLMHFCTLFCNCFHIVF
jgi:hypothetical protein